MKFIYFVLVLVFLTSCTNQAEIIKNKINDSNYCETKDDCVDLGGKCPFDCYIYVNKNEVEKIRPLVESYESNCVYDCVYCPDVTCTGEKCIPKCS
ncbi:hypothetical protein JXM83_04360 [Candidatus Woesearchaeota archaeon]|nr:hypothetical protein [Candidatus Woesearchaeota archaeon]